MNAEYPVLNEIRMKDLLRKLERILPFCTGAEQNRQKFGICQIFRSILLTFLIRPLLAAHFLDRIVFAHTL